MHGVQQPSGIGAAAVRMMLGSHAHAAAITAWPTQLFLFVYKPEASLLPASLQLPFYNNAANLVWCGLSAGLLLTVGLLAAITFGRDKGIDPEAMTWVSFDNRTVAPVKCVGGTCHDMHSNVIYICNVALCPTPVCMWCCCRHCCMAYSLP